MDDVQFHAVNDIASPGERERSAEHGERREQFGAAVLRCRFVPIHIVTSELQELSGSRRRESGQLQREQKMLVAKRTVDGDGGEEMTTIGHRRGHQEGYKKTSGGVAPIHLRKCATAKKP